MSVKRMIVTKEAERGFYPTPRPVSEELLNDIDFRYFNPRTILEPSAGKGDLVESVGAIIKMQSLRYDADVEVDAIEIDSHLRSILAYEFSNDKKRELKQRLNDLKESTHRRWNRDVGSYEYDSPEQEQLYKECERAEMARDCVKLNIVHDDFLTYDSRKRYGLIVMNPPFAEGDRHLLRAIEMQERDGGMIRCILNAETLLNPYTQRRRDLLKKLQEWNAEIKYLDGAFQHAERQTDVNVAIIKINIPHPERQSAIFERLKKDAKVEEKPVEDVYDLTVTDFISQIVSRFNVEADAGIELIHEFRAMRPYTLKNECCMSLCVGRVDHYSQGQEGDINEYLRLTRLKYWKTLFRAPQFVGRLTSAMQAKYQAKVNEMKDYDFTEYNIKQLYAQMNVEVKTGIESAIMELFEKLTAHYSWIPEMDKHRLHFNTWKHNKVEKVSNWVIIPRSGFASEYIRRSVYDYGGPAGFLADIERVLNYLDGRMTECVDTESILKDASRQGQTRKIQLKYFTVDIYKKGTIHIKFTDKEMLNRFNIYCSQKRGWLPPNYGRTTYSKMTEQERAVVDEFHGDGSAGSGQSEYQTVFEKASFYLAEPAGELPALLESEA